MASASHCVWHCENRGQAPIKEGYGRLKSRGFIIHSGISTNCHTSFQLLRGYVKSWGWQNNKRKLIQTLNFSWASLKVALWKHLIWNLYIMSKVLKTIARIILSSVSHMSMFRTPQFSWHLWGGKWALSLLILRDWCVAKGWFGQHVPPESVSLNRWYMHSEYPWHVHSGSFHCFPHFSPEFCHHVGTVWDCKCNLNWPIVRL